MTDVREKKGPDGFFVLGWITGIGFLLDLAANLGDPFEVLWFCSLSTLLLTFGLFRRNTLLITMVFVLAIPAQFFWILDFILEIFGKGFGRTAMLASSGPTVYWTSLLLHVLLIPVSAFAVWRLGFDRRALWPAFGYVWALLAASYFLTEPALNHNCAFFNCDAADPGGGYFFYFLSSGCTWSSILIVTFMAWQFVFRRKLLPVKDTNG